MRPQTAVAGASPATPAALRRDVLIAAILGAFMVAGTLGAQRHMQQVQHVAYRNLDVWGVLLLVAIAGSLAVRRRYPVAVVGAVSGLTFVYFLANYTSGPVWLGMIVAYATAVILGHRLAAGVGAFACYLVLPWLADLLGRGPAPTPLFLSILAAGLLLLFGVSEAVRMRRQRSAEVARRRREEEEAAASEERLRIARDLHDVLAHNISLINVQAGVALHVNDQLPEQARSALAAIKDASREALGELRSALDALRQSGDPAPMRPSPGLDQLDDLVVAARASGLEVSVEVTGAEVALPPAVDVAAYRIVQEALTNVIRHAGASRVGIAVGYTGSAVTLAIDDNGHGMNGHGMNGHGVNGSGPAGPSGNGLAGQGHGSGIVGMRERAQALGGQLITGAGRAGGFSVFATLPVAMGDRSPSREQAQ
ncbi:MAG TPA: histidine kinase [Actinomycetota bacterium]|nr:histidine kinase [Actinomycetota bacterium]